MSQPCPYKPKHKPRKVDGDGSSDDDFDFKPGDTANNHHPSTPPARACAPLPADIDKMIRDGSLNDTIPKIEEAYAAKMAKRGIYGCKLLDARMFLKKDAAKKNTKEARREEEAKRDGKRPSAAASSSAFSKRKRPSSPHEKTSSRPPSPSCPSPKRPSADAMQRKKTEATKKKQPVHCLPGNAAASNVEFHETDRYGSSSLSRRLKSFRAKESSSSLPTRKRDPFVFTGRDTSSRSSEHEHDHARNNNNEDDSGEEEDDPTGDWSPSPLEICVCGEIHNADKWSRMFWLKCKGCKKLFDVFEQCVRFSEEEAAAIVWQCDACEGSAKKNTKKKANIEERKKKDAERKNTKQASRGEEEKKGGTSHRRRLSFTRPVSLMMEPASSRQKQLSPQEKAASLSTRPPPENHRNTDTEENSNSDDSGFDGTSLSPSSSSPSSSSSSSSSWELDFDVCPEARERKRRNNSQFALSSSSKQKQKKKQKNREGNDTMTRLQGKSVSLSIDQHKNDDQKSKGTFPIRRGDDQRRQGGVTFDHSLSRRRRLKKRKDASSLPTHGRGPPVYVPFRMVHDTNSNSNDQRMEEELSISSGHETDDNPNGQRDNNSNDRRREEESSLSSEHETDDQTIEEESLPDYTDPMNRSLGANMKRVRFPAPQGKDMDPELYALLLAQQKKKDEKVEARRQKAEAEEAKAIKRKKNKMPSMSSASTKKSSGVESKGSGAKKRKTVNKSTNSSLNDNDKPPRTNRLNNVVTPPRSDPLGRPGRPSLPRATERQQLQMSFSQTSEREPARNSATSRMNPNPDPPAATNHASMSNGDHVSMSDEDPEESIEVLEAKLQLARARARARARAQKKAKQQQYNRERPGAS
eukprot:CAMPEP_0113447556 /NCGR_PEP_ID=MMETSP0014_2-20120614/4297_1 /TAXON_ID=2857 /ORGANISM="Nitzschia sp." /LENGTH=864 /DNA_ID=CAMNT_0000338711 /DNA_START=68 /DNA_END=2662 /DNA_ORIENTATION=- /assembly_acc=CAM_ASM_000159